MRASVFLNETPRPGPEPPLPPEEPDLPEKPTVPQIPTPLGFYPNPLAA